jgi:hypothetical protein
MTAQAAVDMQLSLHAGQTLPGGLRLFTLISLRLLRSIWSLSEDRAGDRTWSLTGIAVERSLSRPLTHVERPTYLGP